jgi:hypothetical protein
MAHVQAAQRHGRHDLRWLVVTTDVTFVPTHEWQDVPDDAILPPGLDIKVDLTTGSKQARIKPNGNGHAYAKAFTEAFPDEWQAGDPDPSIIDTPDRTTEPGAVQPFPYAVLQEIEPELTSKFVIHNLIPYEAFGEIYAPPGGGKTSIAVDMALHIASGRYYRGRRTERHPVVYIALEGHGGINNRVVAARRHLGLDDQEIAFALVKVSANFQVKETAQRVAANVKAMIERFGIEEPCNPVVPIDTFQAALGGGGSDCDPTHVTRLIENVKAELISIGCTVIVIHHTGKDAAKGARGWSGLLGALDFELEIDRKKDARFMYVSKQRDTTDEQPAMCYRLFGLELGENQYGEKVTAAVVDHLKDADGTNKGNKLTTIERATLDMLWKLIKDPQSSWPIPEQQGLKCTMMGVLKKACIAEGAICQCKQEKDRAVRFRAAIEGLTEKGAIICDGKDDQRVYPTPKGANFDDEREGDSDA